MTVYVYALTDPNDGTVRYVGKSRSPAGRIKSHLSRSASVRVREFVAAGAPGIEILAECPNETAALAEEMRLIKKLKAEGVPLLNFIRSVSGGLGRKRRFSGFGKRCTERRERLGLMQNELASMTGVSAGHISRLESGRSECVTADVAVAIADALQCSVRWLVTGEGSQT